MDKELLVRRRLGAGIRLLNRLSADGFDVAAALWMRSSGENHWHLFIATPIVEQMGAAQAYRRLMESLRKLEGIPLSFAEIKLIGAESPVASDVEKIPKPETGRAYFKLKGKQFGDYQTDYAYIYLKNKLPRPGGGVGPDTSVLAELFRDLMRGPGPAGLVRVMLRDGTSFGGALTGIHLESGWKAIAQFIEPGQVKPRLIDVGEIDSVEYPEKSAIDAFHSFGLPYPVDG